MDSRLEEYLEDISSEKHGDDVRKAIRKAVIVIDELNSKLNRNSERLEYCEAVAAFLDDLWDAILTFSPNAVRPTYNDDPPIPENVMNDDLQGSLIGFFSSIEGRSIRSSLYASISIICNNSRNFNSNFYSYYYTTRVTDMFNAAIDGSEASDESKSEARELTNSWVITNWLNQNVNNLYDSSKLINLSTAINGKTARQLVIDILTSIDSANNLTRTYDEMISENMDDLDNIAATLDGNGFKYYVAINGLQGADDVNSTKEQLEAVDQEDTFRTIIFQQIISEDPVTHTITFGNPHGYVIINKKYWTLLKAKTICANRNNSYPQFTFSIIDAQTYDPVVYED